MHSFVELILERLLDKMRNAAAQRKRHLFQRLFRRFRPLIRLDKSFRLRSPRHYILRRHLHTESFWAHARSLDDEDADSPYMAFMNFPRYALEMLAEEIRPFFPTHDPENPKSRGRPSNLDYKDLLAIGLRSLRVMDGQVNLGIDFAMTQPAISRALALIRPVLAQVVREWKPAEIRMVTGEEGRAMWKTLIAQHSIHKSVAEVRGGMRALSFTRST